MRTVLLIFAAMLSTVLATSAIHAATVSFSRTNARPSSAAIAVGVPFDMLINDYFVTTDADIISFDMVNHRLNHRFEPLQVAQPEGSDTEPPDPAKIPLRPSLAVDSWITTPGPTLRTRKFNGGAFPGSDTWSDTTNDGPQTRFQFARYSIPLDIKGSLEGSVTLAGANGPETFPFRLDINFPFGVPEPGAAALASLGAAALLASRRRVALTRVSA